MIKGSIHYRVCIYIYTSAPWPYLLQIRLQTITGDYRRLYGNTGVTTLCYAHYKKKKPIISDYGRLWLIMSRLWHILNAVFSI
jgi:hypothetical protein